ncbi:MAG: inositol monophosphatase [Arcobacteraceae bacterium]|nr:inositol monophosphatase [Arcobacteraceae bacterium]
MEKIYQLFMKETLKANKKLKKYITHNLSNLDYQSTDQIGAGGDKTKQIDIIAEDIFVSYLSSFCDILSEESGLIKSKINQISNALIIIDPLDGSDNFLSNLPYYGTSVSLRIDNVPIIGIVYNLVNDTYIFKTPNETNFCIKDREEQNFGIFERAYTRPDIVQKLHDYKLKFRSPGATALSLANSNNLTFFLLAGKMRAFDIDAGLLISQDLHIFQNEKFLLVSKNIVIFENVKEIIKGY